ncbi:SCO2400 family protein [Streptomyces coffeae]|uniref:Zinc ribbon domain-containing protein n=1 Tax=Streptomyces coffeae TaxID=621382 RepID=A0ABS1NHL5_9ACTN|nr:hypothetical protein [Streptomyces coffeae]MBL1099612.1 hypothetical protein [Streptomyces coffeae]
MPTTERQQMDYCASCRRTLNGVVTCPECGAYDPLAGPADPKALSSQAIAEQVFGADRRAEASASDAVAPLTAQLGAVTLTEPDRSRRRRTPGGNRRRRRAVAVAALAVVGGLAAGSLLLTQRSQSPSHAVAERASEPPLKPGADPSESTPGNAASSATREPDRASRQSRPTFTAPPRTAAPPRPSPSTSEPEPEKTSASPSATRKPPKETPSRRPSHTPKPPKPSSTSRPGPTASGTATPTPSGSASSPDRDR